MAKEREGGDGDDGDDGEAARHALEVAGLRAEREHAVEQLQSVAAANQQLEDRVLTLQKQVKSANAGAVRERRSAAEARREAASFGDQMAHLRTQLARLAGGAADRAGAPPSGLGGAEGLGRDGGGRPQSAGRRRPASDGQRPEPVSWSRSEAPRSEAPTPPPPNNEHEPPEEVKLADGDSSDGSGGYGGRADRATAAAAALENEKGDLGRHTPRDIIGSEGGAVQSPGERLFRW
eukprot:COSAG01_NODE_4180_length_5264_cov_413.049371_9_plen_235_part_00